MLKNAYLMGIKEAREKFNVKEAALPPSVTNIGRKALGIASEVPQILLGNPIKAIQQGRGAFRAGGVLDPRNVLWPSVERGANGERLPQIMGWLGRAGTAATGYNVYKAMKGEQGDPYEGRASNALGALGGALGMAFGMPAVGLLGAPIAARAGTSLGKGVGRLFNRNPEQAPVDELAYGQGVY